MNLFRNALYSLIVLTTVSTTIRCPAVHTVIAVLPLYGSEVLASRSSILCFSARLPHSSAVFKSAPVILALSLVLPNKVQPQTKVPLHFSSFASAATNGSNMPIARDYLDVYIASQPELQAVKEINQPDFRERLAQMYALYKYFRNGDLSHIQVSNNGNDIENFYGDHFKAVAVAHGGLKKFLTWPGGFAEDMILGSLQDLGTLTPTDSQRLKKTFVAKAKPPTISPVGAYIFLGGFIRHYGISQDVSIVMGDHSALLLRVVVDTNRPLYIQITETGSKFDVQTKAVDIPTMASVSPYSFAPQKSIPLGPASYFHKKAIRRIVVSYLDLHFASPVIDDLARFLGSDIRDSTKTKLPFQSHLMPHRLVPFNFRLNESG